jgi:hypothetical protein
MKKVTFMLAICFCWNIFLMEAQERNLLGNLCSEQEIEECLLPGDGWIVFPEYDDRGAWGEIPEIIREKIIQRGEEVLDFDWGVVKATDFLEFTRSGDRSIMQNPFGARRSALQNLVLAELAEGRGRFLDQIINGIWALSEQTTWSYSAHLSLQDAGPGLPDVEEPIIDLAVGEVSSLFSWTHHFLKDEFDKVNTLIGKRIEYEIKHKVLDVYDQRDDFWWMGFGDDRGVNNWNVWVNHNILTTILLMEEDPERKARNIYKTMRSVDKFINYYPSDGGCDEGPGYWGHAGGALFEYLEMLHMTTDGKIDIFDQEIIKNIGRYIYRAQIAYPYVINFADASARSGSRPGVVYRYGKIIQDPVMQSYGAFLAEKAGWDENIPGGNLEATLMNLFQLSEIYQAEAREPLISDFYLPGLQVCGARDTEGSSEGFFFAAKGGHNRESHNHNDVGNFILYYNGQPAIIDVGVGTYTRKTFSSERYEIWTMQSQYHNTPTINGVQQKHGKQYSAKNVAFDNRGRELRFQADIAGAYPEEAMVHNWYRTISFKRGKSITVTEDFRLKKNQGATSVNFMTCLIPEKVSDELVKMKGGDFSLVLKYDPKKTDVKIEKRQIEDARLKNNWGESLYRLVFVYKQDKLSDQVDFMITDQ